MKKAIKPVMMAALPFTLIAAASLPADGTTLTDESLIIDEEGVIDESSLANEINDLEPADVRIGVLVSDEADEGDYDTTITERLVDLDPDGLIDDGRLADDAVVIVLSPEIRQLGIYSGDGAEDASVVVEPVTDAMRPHAQDEQWEEAIITGAQTYLDETYHAGQSSDDSSASEMTQSDAIVGLSVIGGLTVLVLGSVGILAYSRAADRKKYRQSYPTDKAHLDEAYRLFSRIHNTDTSKVPGAPSNGQADRIMNQLRTVVTNGYQPTDHIRGDRSVRRWTDDLSEAREIADKIDVVEFNEAGQRQWRDGLRQKVEDVADTHDALIEEIEDQPFTEDEKEQLREPLRDRARSVRHLISRVESRHITAYEAITEAEETDRTTKRELTGVVRSIPAVRRARFSRPDDDSSAVHAAVLWPIIAATVATSSTGSSSYSSTSTPVSTFSAGGFSGGSAGF